MPASFLSFIKNALLLVLHLVLTIAFGWLCWAFWGLYEEEKLSAQYQREGQPVSITVDSYSTEKKNWTDYLNNVKYIRFSYHGKAYNARYVQDSIFVSEGTKVSLLYDASSDAFRQRQKKMYNYRDDHSKLLEWTSVSLFSDTNKALLGCFMVSVAFFFLLVGLLARIPGLNFLTSIAGFVMTLLLLTGVVYLTYNAYGYYHYYHQVKDAGETRTVITTGKERFSQYVNNSSGNIDPFQYVYAATVLFNNKERTIPVSEADYDNFSKEGQLPVYYNAQLNDMMATDYRMNPTIFIFTGIVWLLFLFAAGRGVRKWRRMSSRF